MNHRCLASTRTVIIWGILLTLTTVSLLGQTRRFHYQAPNLRADSPFRNDTLPNPQRTRIAVGSAAGTYGLGMSYLGALWYADQDLGRFHFFDDANQWLQLDKAGHVLGGYSVSRWSTGLYRWAGMPKRKALAWGTATSFVAMTSIEILDGFGEGWGFSWSDVGANTLGAGIYLGNQLLWNENRIQLKVSYLPSPYVRVDSLQRLFGSNFAEWLVKDYNGHTHWMSVRVNSFLPPGNARDIWPDWLNLAFGYGGQGVIGGYDRDDPAAIRAREYRQYYLSFDIDLSNIHPRSGFLRTLLQTVSILRIPAPGIQFDRTGVRVGIY